MATISILGSKGVLGSTAKKYFEQDGFYEVISIQRDFDSNLANTRSFDIVHGDVNSLVKSLPRCSYLINCAGVIKQKSSFESFEEKQEAYLVNSFFPRLLDMACAAREIRVIQVATDCVYSGNTGNYIESSRKDPTDFYGLSKALGEFGLKNTSTFRCSFIGKETASSLAILNWVLSQPYGSKINGYTNHHWNGLTTLDVIRIIDGQIKSNDLISGLFHVIPSDSMTKFELVSSIAKHFQRTDLCVVESLSEEAIDRTLSTSKPGMNSDFWSKTPYSYVPTIDEMIMNYSEWCK